MKNQSAGNYLGWQLSMTTENSSKSYEKANYTYFSIAEKNNMRIEISSKNSVLDALVEMQKFLEKIEYGV